MLLEGLTEPRVARSGARPDTHALGLLLKAARGVTIAIVSPFERKRRQPGLSTDDPAFVGWPQLVRGIQGSQVHFDFVGGACEKRTSRSGDRKTARRSRVFRHRSSPHFEGTPRKREKGRHDACGSRDSDRRPTRYGSPDATIRTLPHRQPPVNRSMLRLPGIKPLRARPARAWSRPSRRPAP